MKGRDAKSQKVLLCAGPIAGLGIVVGLVWADTFTIQNDRYCRYSGGTGEVVVDCGEGNW